MNEATQHAQQKALGIGLLALFVGLGLTAIGVQWQRAQLNELATTEFRQDADRIQNEVQRRLTLPQYGLKGLRGTYASMPKIRRAEFRAYVESRDLPKEFPGIRGMGFMERVQRDQLAQFVAQVRADDAPTFTVKTSGTSYDLFVIKFIEPMANNMEAWGYDIGQEPVRRDGAMRAMNTGQPTLTDKITLVQDSNKTPGFLLYVPVYRAGSDPVTPAERQAALTGLAFMPIVAAELFDGITATGTITTDFAIYQGTEAREDQLIYRDSRSAAVMVPGVAAHYTGLREIKVAGSTMTLQVRSTPAFERRQDLSTLAIAGVLGVGASMAIAFALWLLAAGRVRAQQLAQRMTVDLDRMARVVQHTNNAVSLQDAQCRITWINEGFTRMTGYSAVEAIGKTPGELLGSGKASAEVLQNLVMSATAGMACRVEILNRRKDGQEYWVDTEVQPIHDAEQNVVGFMEIGTDITARVNDAQKIAQLSDRMSLAIEGGSDGLWDWMDITQDAQWWSPNYHTILGYTVEELVPSLASHRALMHPDSVAASRDMLQRALGGGAPYDLEVQLRTKYNGYRWFRLRAKVFFDDHGQPIRMAGSTQDIHERKLAQAGLAQTNERFALAAESAGIGVWEWDLATKELRWDAQMYQLYRHSADSGQTPLDILLTYLHPDDKVRFESDLAQTIRNGKPFEANFRIFWPQGEVRHLRAAARVVRDSAGRALRMIGVNFDITEVRRAQEALAESEAILDRAGRIAGVGGWRIDLKAQTVYWSQETRHIHEAQDDYVPTLKRITRFYTPEAKPVLSAAIDTSMKTGKGWDLELSLVTAKGRSIWVRVVGEVEFENGEPVRLVGALQDVTERRKLTEAIQKSNQLMTDVLQNLPCGLSVFDGNLQLVAQNPQLRQLLGLPDSLFNGQETTFEQVIRHNAQNGEYGDVDVETAVMAIVERARNPVPHVFERDRPNGVPLEVRGMPLPGGGFITTYVDISERKKGQKLLTEALEAAQQASVSKSQFLANMSHEIRTPMNAILGMLKLLQKTDLDVRQQDYVDKTKGAARSLLGLLNDILDFSKVEAGKMLLDPRPFQVDRLLRDLSVILSSSVGGKDVEVLFDLDPRLPPSLVGDDMRLQQVLINLGGNAIKFTNQGTVVVRLRQVSRSDEAVIVEFAVQDSGIGIAPDKQAAIFSGFSQAEASTTRSFGGTGLGLSISSRLTALMGGTLQLQSALGMGSTFSFQVRLGFAVPENSVGSTKQKALPNAEALRTLVVDDNAIARQLIAEMAQSLGWQVDTADSGAQALALVQQALDQGRAYQAIFMDWRMREMDGWQTSQSIRKMMTEPPVIIMLTAHGREMLGERSAQEQSLLNGFLVKPVTASMLQEALQDAQIAATGFADPAPYVLEMPKRLQGLRILVVEDNMINQTVAHGLLAAEGAQVTLAANGQQGVDAVTQAPRAFDVVLMDLQMPVMDGYTATRILRQEWDLRQLPIIAMTANVMASDRAACLEAGMNDHVGKPFEIDELVDTILKCIHTRAAVGYTSRVVSAAGSESVPVSFPPGDLDLEGAGLRMGGDTTMLLGALRSFAEDLPLVPLRLQLQCTQGSMQDATRTLHTLKGLAATVGARHLAQVAGYLEQFCQQGVEPDAHIRLLIALQTAVEATLQSLQAVLTREDTTPQSDSVDAPRVSGDVRLAARAAVLNLNALLQTADMRALKAYAQLRASYGAELGVALGSLDKAMADLEFEAASQCCDALLAGVLA